MQVPCLAQPGDAVGAGEATLTSIQPETSQTGTGPGALRAGAALTRWGVAGVAGKASGGGEKDPLSVLSLLPKPPAIISAHLMLNGEPPSWLWPCPCMSVTSETFVQPREVGDSCPEGSSCCLPLDRLKYLKFWTFVFKNRDLTAAKIPVSTHFPSRGHVGWGELARGLRCHPVQLGGCLTAFKAVVVASLHPARSGWCPHRRMLSGGIRTSATHASDQPRGLIQMSLLTPTKPKSKMLFSDLALRAALCLQRSFWGSLPSCRPSSP